MRLRLVDVVFRDVVHRRVLRVLETLLHPIDTLTVLCRLLVFHTCHALHHRGVLCHHGFHHLHPLCLVGSVAVLCGSIHLLHLLVELAFLVGIGLGLERLGELGLRRRVETRRTQRHQGLRTHLALLAEDVELMLLVHLSLLALHLLDLGETVHRVVGFALVEVILHALSAHLHVLFLMDATHLVVVFHLLLLHRRLGSIYSSLAVALKVEVLGFSLIFSLQLKRLIFPRHAGVGNLIFNNVDLFLIARLAYLAFHLKDFLEFVEFFLVEEGVSVYLVEFLFFVNDTARVVELLLIDVHVQTVLEVIGAHEVVEFLLREIQLAAHGAKTLQVIVGGSDFNHAHQLDAVHLILGVAADGGNNLLLLNVGNHIAVNLSVAQRLFHTRLDNWSYFIGNQSCRNDITVGEIVFRKRVEVSDMEHGSHTHVEVEESCPYLHRHEVGIFVSVLMRVAKHQLEVFVEPHRERYHAVFVHAADYRIDRSLTLVVCFFLFLAFLMSQHRVDDPMKTAFHSAHQTAFTLVLRAAHMVFEFFLIDEVIRSAVECRQKLAVGTDVNHSAVAHYNACGIVILLKLRLIDSASQLARLHIPENTFLHRSHRLIRVGWSLVVSRSLACSLNLGAAFHTEFRARLKLGATFRTCILVVVCLCNRCSAFYAEFSVWLKFRAAFCTIHNKLILMLIFFEFLPLSRKRQRRFSRCRQTFPYTYNNMCCRCRHHMKSLSPKTDSSG